MGGRGEVGRELKVKEGGLSLDCPGPAGDPNVHTAYSGSLCTPNLGFLIYETGVDTGRRASMFLCFEDKWQRELGVSSALSLLKKEAPRKPDTQGHGGDLESKKPAGSQPTTTAILETVVVGIECLPGSQRRVPDNPGRDWSSLSRKPAGSPEASLLLWLVCL